MNKKLMIFISLIALVAMLGLGFAFANDSDVSVNYAILPNEELAYADLDNAPVEWQEKILEARNEIIYRSSWSVDGNGAYVHPDGTEEALPLFSDLFPGWDVPQIMDEDMRIQALEAFKKQQQESPEVDLCRLCFSSLSISN